MSDGAFPETPKGSPAAIEAAAELLSQAAELVAEGESTLTQTARGLSGVAWSGLAEGRFTAAAGGLSGVCDGAQEALRSCARAARRYSEALERAKRIIEAEREEYQEAQVAKASGAELVGDLSLRRMHAEPDRQRGFDDAVADAQDAIAAAGDRSQAALTRAHRAREDFDQAQQDAIGQLEGTAAGSTSVFGSPAQPALGGPALGPAFPATGTGGWGSGGGGFGIPAGGLAPFTGQVPFDRLSSVDGYAKNTYDEKHGQTEVDDLTIAITSAASFGTAGPLSALATRGATGAAARGGGGTAAGGAARTGAARTGASRADDAARATTELRSKNIETFTDGVGKAGVPFAGDVGKAVAQLSHQEVRSMLRTYLDHYRAHIAAAVKPRAAALLAAGSLSRGVRKGLSDDAIARLKELSGVP
jgi:hypothetical protein